MLQPFGAGFTQFIRAGQFQFVTSCLMSFLQSITSTLKLILQKAGNGCQPGSTARSIWGYVAVAFNRVDTDRLAKVGPNRLCAEWVIKNGGGVRLVENPSKLWKDYNLLPPENTTIRIKVVDASNASIMKIGLEHFQGCNHIDTVILHNCKHLENDGLEGLRHLKANLSSLQVSGCYNISGSGLAMIEELVNLKQLLIFDMVYVNNMDEIARRLGSKLPGCDIKATKFAVQPKQ